MDRDDIIRMAREAGFTEGDLAIFPDLIVHFATLVAAAEREACAKVCDGMDHNGVMIAADCAAAIRARGES